MTNELAVFNYQGDDVRVVKDDQGNPWWVAKDVCDVLGIDSTHTRRLDEDEKGLRLIQTLGGEQEMLTVNEPDFYSLIIRSNKPEAREFRRWIIHEVLPSIRKTGGYSLAIPKTLPEALRAYADEVEKREKAEKQLAIAAPKAEFFDAVADRKDAIDMGRVAKVLDCGIV